MNPFALLGAAFQIAEQLASAAPQLQAGQPVSAPGIKTYIGKQHVEIDVTIKPLSS